MVKNNNYSAKDIEILEGLEPVRKRPGMYIGGTDETAFHHLATEIIDNSMDEVTAGHAKNIYVKLNKDKSLTVTDDGRGIPLDKHPKKNKTALEIVMTTLHSGGKFKEGTYSTSAGLHGVGLSVVNALSEKLKIEVFKNSTIFEQNYSKGKPLNKLTKKGRSKIKNGTQVTFTPDKEIFGKELNFVPNRVYNLCKSKAYLVKGITIHWECDRTLINRKDDTPNNAKLFFPDGIVEYLDSETKNFTKINDKTCHHKNNFDDNKGKFEFAIQWHNEISEFKISFCNSVLTTNGGTHEQGFRSGVAKSIRKIAKFKNNKLVASASADEILSNASYIVSVFINNPEFEGQTKSRLSSIINAKIRGVLGKENLISLISTNRTKLMSQITKDVAEEAKDFGINVIDVRIKRADLPTANSEAIFKRMQTERTREAKEFRAEGFELGQTIKSTADKEATILLAEARKKSQILRGEGDGQRNKIFADAFGRDPEFFSFYRAMQSYEKSLISGSETSLVLSPDSEFFRYFGESGLNKILRKK